MDLQQMILANVSLGAFGIILSLIPVVYLINGKRYRLKINRYFFGIAVSNICMIIGALVNWLIQEPAESWEKIVHVAFAELYYVSSAFILYFFAHYIITYARIDGKPRRICLLSVTAVCAVQVFFVIVSLFTGSVFYMSDAGYHRGPMFFILQIIPLFCYLLFIVIVILFRKQLKKREMVFFLLYTFMPLLSSMGQLFLQGLAVVNVGVELALLLILVNIQFEHEIALREQEKVLAEQRIDIMLSQIQPHFLYNSLAVIHHLCEENPAKAKKMLKEFSEFLRGNMYSLKAREPIPFERELNHAMNYLYLEQQRLGERLHVICRIQTTAFCVPPLTLQPLVENAVQHGIFHEEEGGTIVISTIETEKYAVVKIEDNGVGIEKAKEYPDFGDHASVGIDNVRSRLKEMVDGHMEIESSDRGTSVTLWIPWNDI